MSNFAKNNGVFKASAKGKTAEILIYDVIGEDPFFGGVGAKDFVDALTAFGDMETINVRINSPGGDVFEGVAIYNALMRNSAQVDVYVDGLAASAASMIAMAGDKIYMAPTAMMMIHGARAMAYGPSGTMRELADVLDKVNGQMAIAYARSGQSEDEIAGIMSKDTYLTAQEAVDAGFADEITSDIAKSPKATAKFDLTALHVPHRAASVEQIKEIEVEKTYESKKNAHKEAETEENEMILAETAREQECALFAARRRQENLRLAEI